MKYKEFKRCVDKGYKLFEVIKPIYDYVDNEIGELLLEAGEVVELAKLDSFNTPNRAKFLMDNGDTIWLDFEEIRLYEETLYDKKEVNQHYVGKIQPIEFIQSVLADNNNINGFQGACIKDIIKYSSRFGKKDEKEKEAKKIVDYSLWLLLETMGVPINPREHNHTTILKAMGIEECSV